MTSRTSYVGRSLLRGKQEWVAKAQEAGYLLIQIGVFALGWWLTSLIPDADLLLWVVGLLASFIAALFLPSLLFGWPLLKLEWRINDDEFAEGYPFVDLSAPNPLFNGPEIIFTVDLIAEYRSLLGFVLLRGFIKRGWVVWVEFGPPGIVDIKEQKRNRARVIVVDGAPVIEMSITKAKHQWKQSRLMGSFQPAAITAGRDKVQFALSLRDPSSGSHHIQAAMTNGIDGLDVRS